MLRYLTAFLFVPILPTALPAQSAPKQLSLVRIVVLDTSGSMAGERIEQARKELLDLGRQLPPSPSHPFIVVPFSHTVGAVNTFNDLPSYERFIQGVQAGGGTSIARGLERGIKELTVFHNARHICVLLYTDGEDGDQAGILKQEEVLDRLFSARGKRGLHQSVVFAKRWEKANAELLQRITKRGNAQVIDAGDLQIQPVIFTPTLTVAHTQWAKDQPRLLEITINARAEAKGLKTKGPLPAMHVVCITANLQGDLKTVLPVNQSTPHSFKLRLPVTSTMAATRKVDLQFELSLPVTPDSAKQLLLPLLPFDRITLPVPLPSESIRHKIQTRMMQAKSAWWHDPVAQCPAVALMLTLDVHSDPPIPWPEPVTFQVKPQSGQKILSGNSTITLNAPGSYPLPLTIAAPSLAGDGKTLLPFRVAMLVAPRQAPAQFTFEPQDSLVALDVPPPAFVRTKLLTRTKSISATRWVDVLKATALFEADVEFTVDGPLAKDTVVVVQCPPVVRNLQLHPSTIQPGTQVIRFTVEAELSPAPTRKTLSFILQPPLAQGGVRIVAPRPLQLTVTGPAAVQLALSQDRTVPATLEAHASTREDHMVLPVTPLLFGLPNSAKADGIHAAIHSGPKLELPANTKVMVNAPIDLCMKSTAHAEPSFFLDTILVEELTVVPEPITPAIMGSQQQVVFKIEAPFKRLIFYLTAALAALLVLFLLGRMYQRLTSV